MKVIQYRLEWEEIVSNKTILHSEMFEHNEFTQLLKEYMEIRKFDVPVRIILFEYTVSNKHTLVVCGDFETDKPFTS